MILDHESDRDPVCGSVRARADLLAKHDPVEQATAQALECVELVRGRSSERIIRGGTIPTPPLYFKLQWGCSSAGRAPRSHRGGQGFESPHLHHSPDP